MFTGYDKQQRIMGTDVNDKIQTETVVNVGIFVISSWQKCERR